MIARLLTVLSCRRRSSAATALVIATVAAAVVTSTAQESYGQLNLRRLIGPAVSDLDRNQYPEVLEAIKRFSNSDLSGARKLLEAAAEKYPQLPPVDVTIAKMYVLANQNAGARSSLEAAVARNPNDPEAYIMLADTQFRSSSFSAADALYEKSLLCLENFDSNAKRRRAFLIAAHAGRAAIAEGRAHWDRAAEHLRAWLAEAPDNASANLRLGRALFRTGAEQESLQYLRRAHQLDSTLQHPYVAIGQLYQDRGETEKAKQAFAKAYQEDKNNIVTLLNYARWLIQSGSPSAAEAPLASARRKEPNSVSALIFSGIIAKLTQKPVAAEEFLTKALNLSPTDETTLNELTLLLIDKDDEPSKKRAYQYAQLNVALHPSSSNANVTNVWVLYQLGRAAQANAELQKALKLGRLSADSYFLLSKIFFDQSRMDEALTFVNMALQAKTGSQGIFVHREEAEALREAINRTRED